MELGDEQEVIDCLYPAQRLLMDFDIKVGLESEGLIITLSKGGVNIMMRFSNLMIDNLKLTEEGLSKLLHETATSVWVKIR